MAESAPAKYSFTDAVGEVFVDVPLPADLAWRKHVAVKITKDKLLVKVSGDVVVDATLHAKVDADDSDWEVATKKGVLTLTISLTKVKQSVWSGLEKVELDPSSVDYLHVDDDDAGEDAVAQAEDEKKLTKRFEELRAKNGLDNEDTLNAFFKMFDCCIQLYRLNKLYAYLEDVVPVCRKRGDQFKIKAIQAKAFVLWKQSKFREAIPIFLEMEEILGKNAALCENIAHTYNSLGDYPKAEEYFRDSLKFIESDPQMRRGETGNKGGVLLGLGLVRDRQNCPRDALPILEQAYQFYKDRAMGQLSSLQAKAGISCAKVHAKLGNLPRSEEYIRESCHVYEVTCGAESPLLASACHELGEVLWKQRKRLEAREWLEKAYRLEAIKDAFNLTTVLEIHQLLMDTHLRDVGGEVDRQPILKHQPLVELTMKRVRAMEQDGNAAVYYKAAAELYSWGGKYQDALGLFVEAIDLLAVEKSTDCSSLISQCKSMKQFCERNLNGSQASPMVLKVDNVATSLNSADSGTEVHDKIVPLAHGDFAQVRQMWIKAGVTKSPMVEKRLWAGFLAQNEGLNWAAVDASGVLVGLVVCGTDGIRAYLHQMCVSPSHSRSAVGAALLAACAETCKRQGYAFRSLLPHALTKDVSDMFTKHMSTSAMDCWAV